MGVQQSMQLCTLYAHRLLLASSFLTCFFSFLGRATSVCLIDALSVGASLNSLQAQEPVITNKQSQVWHPSTAACKIGDARFQACIRCRHKELKLQPAHKIPVVSKMVTICTCRMPLRFFMPCLSMQLKQGCLVSVQAVCYQLT